MFFPNRHPPLVRLALALLAMLLFVVGYQWGNQVQMARQGPPAIQGVRLDPPLELPDFALRDPFGVRFDRASLEGHWTLLAFGDLAGELGQRAVQRLIETRNRLADQPKLLTALQLVLVQGTERLELARDFARLSPALHLLSGEPEMISTLRNALGLAMADRPDLLVIAPDRRLIAILPVAQDGAALAQDLRSLMGGHVP
ncbi:hypothetical protein GWK36_06385 [Caldichromatium japonicum]|uniref:Uncharacterized protein n=1 Tax=Caldichromatium japonicum TaxID=2699430 RepID=A0A6G7VCC8_9GAMM|nr:hypothetical protein [Caldichromatium japonicum]QIK37671.1 hypothetical protein GWK36_06385 [Caldichromatium japonicum]